MVDYPNELSGAFGGFIGTHPVICGGGNTNTVPRNISDECYVITEKTANHVGTMTTKRFVAASVTIGKSNF